jgi:hypothetical protein
MDQRHLKITCPDGVAQHGSVHLDGDDISHGLRSVVLRMNAGDLVTAELDLVYLDAEFEGQAKVIVPEDTQAVLKWLGWTPPAESG